MFVFECHRTKTRQRAFTVQSRLADGDQHLCSFFPTVASLDLLSSNGSTMYQRRTTILRTERRLRFKIITGEPKTWAGPPFCPVNTTLYLLVTTYTDCYTTPTILVRAGARPAGTPPLEEKPSGDFPKTVRPPADWISRSASLLNFTAGSRAQDLKRYSIDHL